MSDPTKLGKFEIRRELGRGAMGVVYEGFDPMIERSVAIKTVRAETLQGADTQEQLARFRREAQAAGRLTHPHIVSIYDFGQDGDTYFIAMEYVKGRELLHILEQNERLEVGRVVTLMLQLLDALDYSHRNGVVHRDIKPANIILLDDGTVKVADFGIARVESSNLTQVGTVMGTPSYMSPEQFMGQTVDGRSDLFSAGVILYQLLTGERPFTGSLTTIMHKVLQEQPLPPSTLNVQVPRRFDDVIRKALAKRPEDRYQTGREFAQAIRDAHAAVATAAAASDSDETVRVQPLAGEGGDAVTQTTRPNTTAVGATTSGQQTTEAQIRSVAAESTRTEVGGRKTAPMWIAFGSVAVLGLAVALWWDPAHAPQPVTPAGLPPAAALPATPPAAQKPLPVDTAGTVVVAALGVADPSDPRFKDDKAGMEAALRADSRRQLVQKTLRLYVQDESLAEHYDRLNDALLSRSGDFIVSVSRESAPTVGKDGLVYLRTQAVMKSRQLQKSLNQMSTEERVDFIRVSGDPKISVRVSTRDADSADAEAQTSPIAGNLLKERIKSFGFRTWSEEEGTVAADFTVTGEARIKKLTAKLPASGLTVTKFTLTSWTVKCTDRESGEEVYFNTTLPQDLGSWATEEQALFAIGEKVADEFSRDFFLQHFGASGQRVVLRLAGESDARLLELLERELVSLGGVLWSEARPGVSPPTFDMQMSGSGTPQDVVSQGIVRPLNGKLGKSCFGLGPSQQNEVTLTRDAACSVQDIVQRLEASPPAGLHGAPAARQRSVVKNPEVLKKLTI